MRRSIQILNQRKDNTLVTTCFQVNCLLRNGAKLLIKNLKKALKYNMEKKKNSSKYGNGLVKM